ncbi:MAG TPA: glycosyltransferase family 4 protein [Streptosporangiaceae bacterium]|jgi:glycosyltransferase involved in cell wall biosynthesis
MGNDLTVCYTLATSAGGVGRHVRMLAAGLAARGARVRVYGPAATEEAFGFTAAGAEFTAVEIADRPRPSADLAAVRRLRRLLTGRGADRPSVVHAHGLRAGALTSLALGKRDGRLTDERPPLVVTLHNAPVTPGGGPGAGGRFAAVYGVLERVVARRADRVLGVSPDLVDRMRDRGAASVGRALVPAPELPLPAHGVAAVRAGLGAGDRPILLTVARLAPQKGLGTLLDASRTWAGRPVPPLVLIAGDGPLRAELAARVADEGLPVRLLGDRSDVADLLSVADVVVVPSVWEGQPLIVQEALRVGRPMVATRVGGMPSMIGEGGLLVPAGDAAGLGHAVAEVLDDPELAGLLGAKALARGLTLPGEDDAVDHVCGVYADAARVASGR